MLAMDALDGLGEGRDDVLRFAALRQRVTALSSRLTEGECSFTSFGERHEASPT